MSLFWIKSNLDKTFNEQERKTNEWTISLIYVKVALDIRIDNLICNLCVINDNDNIRIEDSIATDGYSNYDNGNWVLNYEKCFQKFLTTQ